MNKKIGLYFLLPALLLVQSCETKKKTEEKPLRMVSVPAFNADSAYNYVAKQVKFGPRVPNTPAHRMTAGYLIEQFKKFGAEVTEQDFEATTWDNQKLKLKNIIASYNPMEKKRIILASHWDTRPYADKDTEKKDAPFDGANDGASGVGILLEIARAIHHSKLPDVGVDIILFDGEDWGEKENERSSVKLPDDQSWWCLGSQYWSKHNHTKNYSAYFGILLDMVGAKHAQFFREGVSLEYAPTIVEKVWNTAHRLGYTDYFVKTNVAGITDDHEFVNTLAKIPMIDIVHYEVGVGFFGDYHHSRKDNLSIISKETLGAVGNTLLNVVYYEE